MEWVFRHWNTSLKNESFFWKLLRKTKKEWEKRGKEGGKEVGEGRKERVYFSAIVMLSWPTGSWGKQRNGMVISNPWINFYKSLRFKLQIKIMQTHTCIQMQRWQDDLKAQTVYIALVSMTAHPKNEDTFSSPWNTNVSGNVTLISFSPTKTSFYLPESSFFKCNNVNVNSWSVFLIQFSMITFCGSIFSLINNPLFCFYCFLFLPHESKVTIFLIGAHDPCTVLRKYLWNKWII